MAQPFTLSQNTCQQLRAIPPVKFPNSSDPALSPRVATLRVEPRRNLLYAVALVDDGTVKVALVNEASISPDPKQYEKDLKRLGEVAELDASRWLKHLRQPFQIRRPTARSTLPANKANKKYPAQPVRRCA